MIFILHQVNCQNAFGAGFAKYVAKHCPTAKGAYHTFCKCIDWYDPSDMLGECLETYSSGIAGDFNLDELPYDIVHLFAQNYYGNSHKTGINYTNYNALKIAIKHFRDNHPNATAICPQYMGCGLAGGNWSTVKCILKEYNIIPCDDIDLTNMRYHIAEEGGK